jgi:hypothetical protein
VTVIQSIPSSTLISTVRILHDGVTFGQAGGGFKVTGGNRQGIAVDLNAFAKEYGIVAQHNVTIAGNVDSGDQNGFVFNGAQFIDRPCPDPSCISTAQIIFSDNESSNNGWSAFSVYANMYRAPIILQSNFARAAAFGFSVSAGGQDELGESNGARNIAVLGNVAVQNGVGFQLTVIGRTEDNTAADNSQSGFWVVPLGTFRGNSALGNAGPGVIVDFSSGVLDFPPLTNNFSSFAQNNFYGNDRNRPALNISIGGHFVAPNPGPSAQCGVLNLGDVIAAAQAASGQGSLDPQVVQAGGNFWGSAHGPAPTGVGDAVGGVCDQNGAVTIVKPFATTPFAITAGP